MKNVKLEIIPPGTQLTVDQVPHPIIYADQLVGMGVGAFVSRVTFGTEINKGVTTTVTLVIPTDVFQNMANQIKVAMENTEIQQKLKASHIAFQQLMTE